MAFELYNKLQQLRINVSVSNDQLDIKAPKGVLNAGLLEEIRSQKQELMDFLNTYGRKKTTYDSIPALPLSTQVPVSPSQRRLWILSQSEESNITNNISRIYILEGSLDRQAMETSFEKLIDRHESLRTTFRQDTEGDIVQVIHRASPFRIRVHDLRGNQDPETFVKTAVQRECLQPFDLASGPLLRVDLFQVTDMKWIFLYVMHHIISDGWSMSILMRELMTLYVYSVRGLPAPLAPLRIHYKDYAAWQRQQLGGPVMAGHKKYWLQQLAGELPVLELPADKLRPPVKTYNGGMITTRIPTALYGGIKHLGQEEGGSLFMGLLAAVYALLFRYTEQQDILIGSPIAGREHADLEDQIGFYLNTLALRTQIKEEDSFRDLLTGVRQLTLDAYAHQAYPFDELLRELDLQRDKSRNPLFDVFIDLQTAGASLDVGKQSPGGLSLKTYETAPHLVSKFDLTFLFIEQEEGLSLLLEYNSDLYLRETAARISAHFEKLLTEMVKAPDLPVAQLNYIEETEIHRLLNTFNPKLEQVPDYRSVISLFDGQVAAAPDSTALLFGDTRLTYKELAERSDQMAGYLQSNYALRPGSLVGIMMDRSEKMIIAILGTLKAGGVYVPIDPEVPRARKAFIMEDTGIKVLLTQADHIFDLEYYTGAIIALDVQSFDTNDGKTFSGEPIDPQQLAYVIYTSGSTGEPKGCAITHENLSNYIQWADSYYFPDNKPANFGLFTSLSFDLTVTSIFCALTSGGALSVYGQTEEVAGVMQDSFGKDSGIDSIKLTPSHINLLAHLDIRSSTMQRAIVGGEQMTSGQVHILKHINPQMEIYNEYGPTEATVGCVVKQLQEGEPILIGQPIAGAGIYILDKGQQLCPIGIAGEICIGGVGLAREYLNRPELTAEKFVANPFKTGARMYRTGDLGKWLPDGNLVFMGRRDEQVKIRGYRIEPGEIEKVLQSCEGVEAAVVLAKTREDGEKELVAYVVGKKDLQTPELRSSLIRRLPAYMVPAHFVQLPEFPLTQNGKIDRQRLPDPAGLGLTTGIAYVAPRTEVERQLIAVCEEVLKKQPIGIKDDFFMLSGDSIKSIQVVARLKQRGYTIAYQDVLSYPALEEMAARITTVSRFIPQEPVTGRIPLSPIQHWFFNNGCPDKHHYNQSVLLQNPGRLSEDGLRSALEGVVRHHDALRMVYRSSPEGWIQENRGLQQSYHLEIVEFADWAGQPRQFEQPQQIVQPRPPEQPQQHELPGQLEQPEQPGQNASRDLFAAYCDRVQSGIDLAEGPLLKACLFRGYDRMAGQPGPAPQPATNQSGDRLLLVIHHLVTDGVSWRILLEDLSSLYTLYLEGQPLVLPQKTDSFLHWQELQLSYAGSETLRQEEPYWSSLPAVRGLPVDNPQGTGLVKDSLASTFTLDEPLSAAFMTRCYQAYRTEANDILLTALGLAVAEVF
ncbi:MAG TPA: amino acid adenylation domain-containing protein, partial [Puia sp.]|nr:amino acid adenylation domain-containing protein [Puia sp.]